MSYTQHQTQSHIKELQGCLHAISCVNPQIPLIIPDGIYDGETANAVRAFQREYGLNESGRADMSTWNKIVQIYREIVEGEIENPIFFPSANHIVKIGESGLSVYVIQAMLCVISGFFDNFECPQINGVYNNETAKCVRKFQLLNNLSASGFVDRKTWNMLVKSSKSCCL